MWAPAISVCKSRCLYTRIDCTEGAIGSDRRERANRVGGGNGHGSEVGSANEDVNSEGDRDRAGTGTGLDASEQTQDRTGCMSLDGAAAAAGTQMERA